MNLSYIRPNISFLPIIMDAITNPNPSPEEERFTKALGDELVYKLKTNWERIPKQDLAQRFRISRELSPTMRSFSDQDFPTKMAFQSLRFIEARQVLINERKRLIKQEAQKILTYGTSQPPNSSLPDLKLAHEAQRYISDKYGSCRCENPGNSTPPPPEPPKKFGLKGTKLKCHDQREVGHDEIYFISAVADGNAQLITTVSPRVSINDDDNDVKYPNFWMYPMQDPGGFLDLGISMREDDGGYEEAGQIVTKIGDAVSDIPTPYTVIAGAAITIIGELINLSSFLDDDDKYGDAFKTWSSQSNLENGVGSYLLNFYEADTGTFDDGHDFDFTINLLSV